MHRIIRRPILRVRYRISLHFISNQATTRVVDVSEDVCYVTEIKENNELSEMLVK